MSLRLQLLLVSLAVLVLPLTGWQFVREMEQTLRAAEERALTAAAHALAVQLAAYYPPSDARRGLYVRRIDYPPVVDGYGDDWALWRPWAQHFGAGEEAPVRIMLAADDQFVYLLLTVADASRDYLRPGFPAGADRTVLTLGAAPGAMPPGLQFLIATSAPGAFEARPAGGDSAVRLRGVWRETRAGYQVELRVPAHAVGDSLGFTVWNGGESGSALAASGDGDTAAGLVPLVRRSAPLDRQLETRFRGPGKVWLLNNAGWVLASHGEITPVVTADAQNTGGVGAWLYRHWLGPPAREPRSRPEIAARLDTPEVRQALSGEAAVRWQRAPLQGSLIASVAVPVRAAGATAGALVLEQTSQALLLFTNQAMVRLVGMTLIVFGAVALVLLGFASVLSWRVLKLRDHAERALTPDGRLRGNFPTPGARDEVGDLGRSFAHVLAELKQHTDYLRTLADKLSHELRTPLAMVRSSLDNLDSEALSEPGRDYARRARQGTERLAEILRAMGEASRLEASIKDAEILTFDLAELVRTSVGNWRGLRGDLALHYRGPADALPWRGAPELMARLLDKLLENAADFTGENGAIEVSLARQDDMIHLAVANQGPPLPPGSAKRLFESLVSHRGTRTGTPHLGLGLYIARLITEFHAGRIEAENIPGGVRFRASLPAA